MAAWALRRRGKPLDLAAFGLIFLAAARSTFFAGSSRTVDATR